MTLEFEVRTELQVLASRIQEDPRLELTSFDIGAPLPETSIAEVEEILRTGIPESVRRLYRSMAHATLCWRFRPDLDELTRIRVTEDFAEAVSRNNLYTAAGSIRIISLEEMLLDEEYVVPSIEPDAEKDSKLFVFDGEAYAENKFEQMLHPFDLVDDFFAMAFVVQPGKKEWKMMLLDDHWASYQGSRLTRLEDYLKYTIATWGLVNARPELFGRGRGNHTPLGFDRALAAARVPSVLLS
ncbi:hypothetical protein PUR49_04660 [Streptomyces sp. BE147]|uniref:hypothetical protein n=1 Tax=Streptomyces sp. BE147 TaxID=3002524 RepID=UPI002E77421D|nr:hypothetical protein [Streptomyces sp. BE147]MEE1735805.1 hypothetical protein [Streptomyces sp. BE147]